MTLTELHRLQVNYQWEQRRTNVGDRIARLKRLKSVFMDRLPALREALARDLGKNPQETDLTEAAPILIELKDAISHLRKWAKPQKVPTPLTLTGTCSEVVYEPKGVVLILGTWNYPASMLLNPLVAAVAAGNCVILKPSELAPATSEYIRDLIEAVFPAEEVAVVEGGAEVAQGLLNLKFDHIFFTGSTRVGKLIMAAAAQHLTPVTLELGGKSPTLVTASADLKMAAESIIAAKFINSGQTCVAPDFIMVQESVSAEFVDECKLALKKYFGANEDVWIASPDLCRIVNRAHYERLCGLYRSAIASGARRETGGVFDDAGLKIAAAILTDVKLDSPIMKEEIFGPLLPVLTFTHISEVVPVMRQMGKPLASYVFANSDRDIQFLRENIPAGGTCVNTCLLHLGNPWLPFGGVGDSGMGSYHGRAGFKTFSHERAVLTVRWADPLKVLRPPYSDSFRKKMAWLLKYLR